jgi:hypothetical protein
MVSLFGRVRDDWIASDLAGWLAPNRIYPGVAEAVKEALAGGDEVYVVTTKQVLRPLALTSLVWRRHHWHWQALNGHHVFISRPGQHDWIGSLGARADHLTRWTAPRHHS